MKGGSQESFAMPCPMHKDTPGKHQRRSALAQEASNIFAHIMFIKQAWPQGMMYCMCLCVSVSGCSRRENRTDAHTCLCILCSHRPGRTVYTHEVHAHRPRPLCQDTRLCTRPHSVHPQALTPQARAALVGDIYLSKCMPAGERFHMNTCDAHS